MKTKMNLKDLKVKSFVTNMDNEISETVKAGAAIPGDGVVTVPFSFNIQCASALGLISQCCPSEYRTACESGNLTCYEEKDPEKVRF